MTSPDTASQLRILIAEDVDLVGEAFEALLGVEPSFAVLGRVTRGDRVLDAVDTMRPDIVLMDVDMPGLDGIAATQALADAQCPCRVLLLTALPGGGHLHRALAAGARGYLIKSTTSARLYQAVKDVAAGGTVIDPTIAAEAMRVGPSPLTPREAEVLRLAEQGIGTQDMARTMFLSVGTVRNYLSSAMSKVGATTRAQAVVTARDRGWLMPSAPRPLTGRGTPLLRSTAPRPSYRR